MGVKRCRDPGPCIPQILGLYPLGWGAGDTARSRDICGFLRSGAP